MKRKERPPPRMDMDGGMRGAGQKETQTAQGHRRSTKRNSGVRTDSRVTVEAAPRARTTDFGKGGVAADIFGTGHTRLATEKWVMERMQKNNANSL